MLRCVEASPAAAAMGSASSAACTSPIMKFKCKLTPHDVHGHMGDAGHSTRSPQCHYSNLYPLPVQKIAIYYYVGNTRFGRPLAIHCRRGYIQSLSAPPVFLSTSYLAITHYLRRLPQFCFFFTHGTSAHTARHYWRHDVDDNTRFFK